MVPAAERARVHEDGAVYERVDPDLEQGPLTVRC
jgi:hypothetical protein